MCVCVSIVSRFPFRFHNAVDLFTATRTWLWQLGRFHFLFIFFTMLFVSSTMFSQKTFPSSVTCTSLSLYPKNHAFSTFFGTTSKFRFLQPLVLFTSSVFGYELKPTGFTSVSSPSSYMYVSALILLSDIPTQSLSTFPSFADVT